MTFIQAVERVYSHYADFNGRARRSEYWYFILFYYLVTAALSLFLFTQAGIVLLGLFNLANLVPLLAVCWRRLHDLGRSGVWALLGLIPLVGGVVLLIWLAQPGQPGPNQYGPDPVYRQAPPAPGLAATSLLSVKCLTGLMQGQTFSVGSAGLLFGRRPDCHVRFPNGTPGVSGLHCRICWRQGVPMLEDLNSTHGTFFADGRRLPPNYPQPIAPGDRFYVGDPSNRFQCIAG